MTLIESINGFIETLDIYVVKYTPINIHQPYGTDRDAEYELHAFIGSLVQLRTFYYSDTYINILYRFNHILVDILIMYLQHLMHRILYVLCMILLKA
jgi:hypothetical protein